MLVLVTFLHMFAFPVAFRAAHSAPWPFRRSQLKADVFLNFWSPVNQWELNTEDKYIQLEVNPLGHLKFIYIIMETTLLWHNINEKDRGIKIDLYVIEGDITWVKLMKALVKCRYSLDMNSGCVSYIRQYYRHDTYMHACATHKCA